MPDQKPTIGRIVHYACQRNGVLVDRPAIIVHVWNPDEFDGSVQLQVFNYDDGGRANDGLPNVTWETSVPYSEERRPHTWHWPERAPRG